MKYKFRWIEQAVYEGIVDAKSQEEAKKLFAKNCPDNADQVDTLDFDGGLAYEILDIEEVKIAITDQQGGV